MRKKSFPLGQNSMKEKKNRFRLFFFFRKTSSAVSVSSVVKNSLGFTLFEVMITLSILGVVVSLLYLTLHQSMAVMAETEDRAEVIRQGRMILEKMAGELKGAALVPPKESFPAYRTGLVGRSTREGKDYLDRLDFTPMPHPWAVSAEGGWGVIELGYSLDRAPGGKGFTLFRRQDEARDGDLLRGGRSLAICDRVRSLSFSYFDRQGKKSKEWNSLEGERRNQLPSRVEIDLRLEDSRGQEHDFRTQVFLPMSG
jgi:prepilin-type N-terminal cleavage/methylation domain-containing protein